jgi:hypothetical protein
MSFFLAILESFFNTKSENAPPKPKQTLPPGAFGGSDPVIAFGREPIETVNRHKKTILKLTPLPTIHEKEEGFIMMPNGKLMKTDSLEASARPRPVF